MTNSFYYYSNKIALMFINLINYVFLINLCFAKKDNKTMYVILTQQGKENQI